MELLGYQGITVEEDTMIRDKLGHLTYLPLTKEIEDGAIDLQPIVKNTYIEI